jgi:hypothetical protein
MKSIVKIGLLLMLFAPFLGQSQCRGYAKRKCRPELKDYTHDGKMNFAQLFPGDKAEIMLTFFKGEKYRLLVCADDTFVGTTYKIYDSSKNMVFDSEKSGKDFFDFKVATTQQLIVEIKIPQEGNESSNEFEITGCVAVMVGLK